MTQWQIIGLGWLGSVLAHDLQQDGVSVRGTHRATFTFGRDEFPRDAANVLLLNTPPLPDLAPAAYVRAIVTAASTHVIFVSSTSVYGAATGRVDEDTPPRPETPGARWLVETEAALAARFGERSTVIRPGGLIGGDRHPVFPLARRGAPVADGPVNLIYREDLIGIIRAVATAKRVQLVNAVAPHHPSKSAYYGAWARRLGLPPIAFTPAPKDARVVESTRLDQVYINWRVPRLDRLD